MEWWPACKLKLVRTHTQPRKPFGSHTHQRATVTPVSASPLPIINIPTRVCKVTYGVMVRCQATFMHLVPTLSGTFTTTNGFQWGMTSESCASLSPDLMAPSEMLRANRAPAFCLQKTWRLKSLRRSSEGRKLYSYWFGANINWWLV